MKNYVKEYEGHKVPEGAAYYNNEIRCFYDSDKLLISHVDASGKWEPVNFKRFADAAIELPEQPMSSKAEWMPNVGEECEVSYPYEDGNFKCFDGEKVLIISCGRCEMTSEYVYTGHNTKHGYVALSAKGYRPQESDKWKEGEERMNAVQQNGNDGEHYEELEANKNKYQREVKEGVFVDVYDVLKAFNVVNPAMSHAIKKMLAPGQRGAKDAIQDMKEAIQSIERAIELEK